MNKEDLEILDKCRISFYILGTQIISWCSILELLPDKVIVRLNGQEYETDYKNIIERMKRPDEVEVKVIKPAPLNSGELTLKGIRRRT